MCGEGERWTLSFNPASRGLVTKSNRTCGEFCGLARISCCFRGLRITQQSIDFVQCTFARADSWVVWGDKRKPDKPWESFKEVARMGLSGFIVFGVLLRGSWRERRARMQVNLDSMRAAFAQREAKLRALASREGEVGKGVS